MKNKFDFILSEHQFKLLMEYTEELSHNVIQKLFSFLNKEKQNTRNKKELLDKIKDISSYLNIPTGFELYILELYLLNYRKDGDYSGLTKDNFIDPRESKAKKVSNTLSDLYSRALMPFRGSNLEGYWTNDDKGEKYYVVKSYGWYPIYINKKGRWYEVTQRYSPSTGRQISNVNPVEWNEDLLDKVYFVTPEEMKMLERGATHEEIMKNKVKNLKQKESEIVSKKATSHKPWTYYGEGQRTPIVIKYKISSIDTEGDKPIVNVDIFDVLKRVNNRSVPTPENYLKGELPGIDKEYVEKKLNLKILDKFRDYVGPRFRYHEPLRDTHNLKFNFNHLKK